MYILLAGHPPFNGPNQRVILRQIKRGQYTFSGVQTLSKTLPGKLRFASHTHGPNRHLFRPLLLMLYKLQAAALLSQASCEYTCQHATVPCFAGQHGADRILQHPPVCGCLMVERDYHTTNDM